MMRLRAFRPTSEKIRKIELHPTHPWLVTADDDDHVSVWNWDHRQVYFSCFFFISHHYYLYVTGRWSMSWGPVAWTTVVWLEPNWKSWPKASQVWPRLSIQFKLYMYCKDHLFSKLDLMRRRSISTLQSLEASVQKLYGVGGIIWYLNYNAFMEYIVCLLSWT